MIRLEWEYNKVQRWFDVHCSGLGISCYHFKELFKKKKEKSYRFEERDFAYFTTVAFNNAYKPNYMISRAW